MRFGCCGGIDSASMFKDAGFDFLEVNIQQVLRGDDDDAAWSAGAPDADALPIQIEAANCLVPGHHPIVGPQRDLGVLDTYMQRVARRARSLGIERLVFGSGGARKRPDGVDEDTAFAHLVEFAKLAGDACAAHGVTLVVEHLNAKECNTIVRLEEEARLIAAADKPSVRALVDTYHYGLEGEHDATLALVLPTLAHVHVAEPHGRFEPGAHGDSDEAFDFVGFFGQLRAAGYDQRISFEGKWSGDDTAALAAKTNAFVRHAWAAAG